MANCVIYLYIGSNNVELEAERLTIRSFLLQLRGNVSAEMFSFYYTLNAMWR
jgi:hypothetical protein